MHAEVVIAYLLSLTDDSDGAATVKRQRSSDNDQASSTIAAMEKLSVMELESKRQVGARVRVRVRVRVRARVRARARARARVRVG